MLRRLPWAAVVFGLMFFGVLGASAPKHAMASPFDACQDAFDRAPDSPESASCFYEVARKHRRWSEGASRLARLRSVKPANHWLTLNLAFVLWPASPTRAEALMRRAASAFSREGDIFGEVMARWNLRALLLSHGRRVEAIEQGDAFRELAERAEDPEAKVQAWTAHARHLAMDPRAWEEAHRILERAHATTVPNPSYWTQLALLQGLGQVCHQLGQLDDAERYLRRLVLLTEQRGDALGAVSARARLADVTVEKLEALPWPKAREAALASVDEAIVAAVDVKHRRAEARLRAHAARLLPRSSTSAASAEHLERCIEVTGELKRWDVHAHCLASLAVEVGSSDAARARRLMQGAMSLSARAGDFLDVVALRRAKTAVGWLVEPRADAIEGAMRDLDVIEALRNIHPTDGGRTEPFSNWMYDYYGLSGRLLRDLSFGADEGSVRSAREQAFFVMERMRARASDEYLRAVGVREAVGEDDPLVESAKHALRAIASVHQWLRAPDLEPDTRVQLERELVRHERRLAALPEKLGASELAGLKDVETALRPDEAMLLYQVGLDEDLGGDFGGGAWVWAVTREETRVHRIPGRLELETMIPASIGFFSNRGEDGAAAAARMYRELVAEAVSALPSRIRSVIVVADGRLHQLPFAALRPGPGQPPLSERYALSVVPSATAWLRVRRRSVAPASRPLLALVDPDVRLTSTLAGELGGFGASLLEFHGLPSAHAAVSHIGGAARVRKGADAAESALKQDVKEGFQIIHFGARAVVDDGRPGHSGVLLAAHAADQDGLLRPAEIVDLVLDGRVVVLGASRSASGELSRGEGVTSLARAFLAAGAQAVVASLWEIEDEDAQRLFDAFYGSVSQGMTVRESVQRAQRLAIAENRPARAWSGLVVFGDGAVEPFPGGSPGHRRVRHVQWALGGAMLLIGLFLAWLTVRVARKRSPTTEAPLRRGTAEPVV